MSAVYLETSALLRMLFGQAGGSDVERLIASADAVVSSRLLKVETDRALLRLALDRRVTGTVISDMRRELRGLWSRTAIFEITREICEEAGRVAPGSRVRTRDAIHLATWRRARQLDPGLEMLSFDDRILGEI